MSGIAVDQLQSSRHEVLPFFVRERVRLGTLFFRNDRAPGLFLRRWLFHGLPGKSGRNQDTLFRPGVNVIFTRTRPAGITTSQRSRAAKDQHRISPEGRVLRFLQLPGVSGNSAKAKVEAL
jgi:hypothetical protein